MLPASAKRRFCAAFSGQLFGELLMVHRGHRSAESIEYRKAKFFCFKNSKFDAKFQERVFTGIAEDLCLFVEAVVFDVDAEKIPDCPTGLVLADNHCQGAFQ